MIEGYCMPNLGPVFRFGNSSTFSLSKGVWRMKPAGIWSIVWLAGRLSPSLFSVIPFGSVAIPGCCTGPLGLPAETEPYKKPTEDELSDAC